MNPDTNPKSELQTDAVADRSRNARSALRSPQFIAALALIVGAAGLLLIVHPKLGKPGIRTSPLADSDIRLKVELPERVLDYISQERAEDDITRSTLPADTSFGQRLYQPAQGAGNWASQLSLTAVLMGTDRTSLHKPQLCLTGQGFRIDPTKSLETNVRVEQPYGYDLPITRLIASKEGEDGGRKEIVSAVYVYWYVTDGAMSAGEIGYQRMASLAWQMLRTGVLQRWAYVSCMCFCAPGQEEATFERMKKFIAAAVPEFQLTPKTPQMALAGQNSQPQMNTDGHR